MALHSDTNNGKNADCFLFSNGISNDDFPPLGVRSMQQAERKLRLSTGLLPSADERGSGTYRVDQGSRGRSGMIISQSSRDKNKTRKALIYKALRV